MTLNRDDIKHRDKTIRKYLKNRNWDKNPYNKVIEFDLIREVAEKLIIRKPELSKYKYIYDYEWELIPGETDQGKGDLIFTDGINCFLIIECKTKDSNFVRTQVIERSEQFKKKISHFETLIICGLAVSPQSWDYRNENGVWDFEIDEKEDLYFQLYKNIKLSQEEEIIRNKFQEFYQKKGIKPKDPISALTELINLGFLSGDLPKHPKNNNPPFLVDLSFELNEVVPEKILKGSGENHNFTKAKGLAAIKVCEQIYLNYDLRSWGIPVENIDRSKVYRIKNLRNE